ncbi:hypothetical protein I7I53_05246 [Histoplasma capsulatum var. duboisii H88]|uniref:Uncharacterized protein n=1 Tax=Ajellomyces capsulatus (strain H88) TaxID=544711 RepID=A0A8A1LSJ6_AJEC8|nr:hypothetical protein I7I53_05246 [Histoplasma capsulatum var. duboisii H88]
MIIIQARKSFFFGISDILRHPSDAFAVALPHHHTAHKQFNRPDTLQRHLPLAGGLVEAHLVAELILRYSFWMIDLVTEDEEGDLGKLFHS